MGKGVNINESILDCSSITTALASFEPVLQKTKPFILQSMMDCNIELERSYDPEEDLVDFFFPERDVCPLDAFVWFHLTRVPDPRCFFSKGILPSGRIIDQIWQLITHISHEKGYSLIVSEIRRQIEDESDTNSADLYRIKLIPEEQGPFALFIRETALEGDFCNHYLKCPEIVADICNEIESQTNIKILDDFVAATSPFIVKFRTTNVTDCWQLVGTALHYIYKYAKNMATVSSDVSFIGKGVAIPPRQIVSIE